MYPHILDVVEGYHELVHCPCDLLARLSPPPLLDVRVPPEFERPEPRFESFRISDGNRTALLYATNWVESFVSGTPSPGPLFCGPVGTGKTRLLWTILKEIAAAFDRINTASWTSAKKAIELQQSGYTPRPEYRRFTYRFFSMARFTEELKDRLNSRLDLSDFRQNILKSDVMAIDDIGAENMTDFVREEIYLLIDERTQKRKPILVSCNFDPDVLGLWLGDRIRSRLVGSCQVIQIDGSDMRSEEKERRIKIQRY